MKFSLLSWNVEKFKGSTQQLKKVAQYIGDHGPDVFGLFEVENLNIIALITTQLPEYDYHLTDGPENKEILVGVRRGKFAQTIFSQKREFKVYNPYLRPGALLSVQIDGDFTNMLFLHTDSGTEAGDFGNRQDMFEKIWSLKKALDSSSPARLIILGDLNTMGMQFPTRRKSDRRVTEEEEIAGLEEFARKRDMALLTKEFDETFNNGKLISNLDHILATDNLSFKEQGQTDGAPFQVKVTGWNQLTGSKRKTFIETISDHSLLFCEIE